ncbi:unnamed protein product [Cuscuta epithymum]|uniref:Uncharacterized protein n=1 Tax=Cuscuta epithymum TaxID=186058 RepID=A0AAV0DDU2_9ASTE|nr:unnamed protein product [Cuscuta epithymum]CAH9127081.1 unnamed protein product [Cuscuta epithymum]
MELARMIILHGYPLKMVEHIGFSNFVNSLNPCFKMVSRNSIKKDCLKIFEIEKKAMMETLEKNDGRVAVTN